MLSRQVQFKWGQAKRKGKKIIRKYNEIENSIFLILVQLKLGDI